MATGVGRSECCDGFMGCQITTRLAVIAKGVRFGPPGWLFRKRG